MHFILSGAYKRAVRRRWVSVSPIGQAEPPPTPGEAARIIDEAWRDPDWGTLLWVARLFGPTPRGCPKWTSGRSPVWPRACPSGPPSSSRGSALESSHESLEVVAADLARSI
jgi:hypothetical protein